MKNMVNLPAMSSRAPKMNVVMANEATIGLLYISSRNTSPNGTASIQCASVIPISFRGVTCVCGRWAPNHQPHTNRPNKKGQATAIISE